MRCIPYYGKDVTQERLSFRAKFVNQNPAAVDYWDLLRSRAALLAPAMSVRATPRTPDGWDSPLF